MRIFWPVLNLLVGGANFERVLDGQTEHFFGTSWFLAFLALGSAMLGICQIIRLARPTLLYG